MPRKKTNRAKRYHDLRRKKRKLRQNSDNLGNRESYKSYKLTKNTLFEKYYKLQNICKDEQDYQCFFSSLNKDLPATIRIFNNGAFRKQIVQYFKDQAEKYKVNPLDFDGNVYEGPKPIVWYPAKTDAIAWRIGTSRIALRKNLELKPFHQFLVREARTENITRQEEVSMIPVSLLDIKPSSKVFDACAAPGSKTSQILEFMHSNEEEATGFLVANDSDPKRAYMLHHQLKPFKSANLMITCAEAQLFPEFKDVRGKKGLFDRILCDVPCSGDVTIRKNRDVYRTWDINHGNSLHFLQLLIAYKCLHLLEVGGLMVYSTCTFNPVENEAVIAQIIRLSKGSVEIVDCSNKLVSLKRRNGLKTWKVATQINSKEKASLSVDAIDGALSTTEVKTFTSIEEFNDFRAKHPIRGGSIKFSKKMQESMFPVKDCDIPLDRCIRILPHDQDTGGFFVCVLRKVSALERWKGSLTSVKEDLFQPVPKKEMKPESVLKSTETIVSKKSNRKDVVSKLDKGLWDKVCDEFGIRDDSFGEQVVYRIGKQGEKGKPKVLNFVSKSVCETLLSSEIQSRLNIIACGVPIIKRSERRANSISDQYTYRLTNDGLKFTSKLLFRANSNRVLKFTLHDFYLFCRYCLYKPSTKEAKEGKNYCPGVPIEKLSWLTTSNESRLGSYLMLLDDECSKIFREQFETELMIAVWLAKKSIAQLINESQLEMFQSKLKSGGLFEGFEEPDCAIESYYTRLNEIRKRACSN